MTVVWQSFEAPLMQILVARLAAGIGLRLVVVPAPVERPALEQLRQRHARAQVAVPDIRSLADERMHPVQRQDAIAVEQPERAQASTGRMNVEVRLRIRHNMAGASHTRSIAPTLIRSVV